MGNPPKCFLNCDYIKLLEEKIKKLKAENERLKKDFLTNTYNRHQLDILLKEEYIPKCKEKPNWFYNIVLIDINNLHDTNRKKGYEAGDELIKNVVEDIRNKMKENYVNGRIFRIGGDEFLVIYQPYDNLPLRDNKNYFVAFSVFDSMESFKKALNEMDKEIIKKKNNKNNKNNKNKSN